MACTRVRAAATTCTRCMRSCERARARAPFCQSPAARHASPTLRPGTSTTLARCQALEAAQRRAPLAQTRRQALLRHRDAAGAIASVPVLPYRGAAHAPRTLPDRAARGCSARVPRTADPCGSAPPRTGRDAAPRSPRRRVPARRPSPQILIRLAARAGPLHVRFLWAWTREIWQAPRARRRHRPRERGRARTPRTDVVARPPPAPPRSI